MKDTVLCPICSNKLKNKQLKDCHVPGISGKQDFTQRTCKNSVGHFLQFILDQNGEIKSLLLTIGYDKTIRINYSNGTTTFILKSHLYDDGPELLIPKILEPDFPKMEKLKERLSLYTLFS